MKAELTSDGTLVVAPENDLEAYALTQWHRHWEKDPNVMLQCGNSMFLLQLTSEAAHD